MSNYGTTSHHDEERHLLNGGVQVEVDTFYARTFRHVTHHRKRYFALWLLAAVAAISTVLGLYYYEKGQKENPPTSPAPGEGEFISGLFNSMGKKDHICESDRSYPIAILLSIFFGYVGIDRFYLGYIISSLLKLITAGGFGIWYIIDIILIVIGALPDHNGCALVAP
ncbi:hypothetical protein BGZ80_004996 [Entomortierella chlamydospora]|uniref:TM2 domain-containing protein n=1 Tax=Entomortierella chlamydospora TaxID=101097 RepID=A0A9P6MMC6_9FUNG|nr:hypothetical protein BGX20_011102 [Mortierella sp. AD010]KAF9382513.1 hypothetical protein BGX21_001797 [Mortierella sp. AD011]KAF9994562.1 hypothetical protein BGZ79_000681 [Entomortierella chlamydospora]KAG0007166.1 hypothetical protein BGZ80_004996 [Entomortierella chlamydospora]